MSVYNSCNLIGRITKDLELQKTQGKGTSYTKFNLAVKRPLDKDKADFPQLIVWGKTAEYLVQYAKKGSMIAVIAEFQSGSFETTDKGTQYTNEFNVRELTILEKTSSGSEPSVATEETKENVDEDTPF